jgi:hypothetical protein
VRDTLALAAVVLCAAAPVSDADVTFVGPAGRVAALLERVRRRN